jgi:hypothetical protein
MGTVAGATIPTEDDQDDTGVLSGVGVSVGLAAGAGAGEEAPSFSTSIDVAVTAASFRLWRNDMNDSPG